MTHTSGMILAPLGEHLAAVAGCSWSTNANYRSTDPWPIFVGRIPPSDQIKNAIAINIYRDDRSRDNASPDVFVQIRIRGTVNPFVAAEKAEQLFQLLHDKTHFHLANRTRVLLCQRVVTVAQDPDENGRSHSVDSYQFTLNPS
ncbi:phage tail terminator protein [Corynebacterium sp. A21]|uniref:phage tail terminator protein n=1 Tax=Corynebacterium sp. A21 TaxID=3457318 RepID=UPI003FD27BAE